MRSERRAAALALLAVALGGCTPPVDDCVDNEACGFTEAGAGGSGGAGGVGGSGGSDGGGGIAGASGSGGSAGEGGTCDTTKSPSEEACLVSDAYAVFVDGTAASSGNGTKASPFKTIGEALTAAGTKNVLVCDTTYDEQVKITGAAKVYGGFACADWAYKIGERAVVKPSAKGYALEVGAASTAVVIADIEFTAQAGTAPGESSIAAFVKSSSDVTLERVKLVAGKGIDGTAGTLTAFAFPSEPTLRGNAASLLAGGAAKSYTSCPGGGSSTGGKGGAGGATPQDGDPGLPNYGGGAGGKGGGAICGAGTIGGSGTNGSDGNGASTVGKIAASGWLPGSGEPGGAGLPGQGGGGGGGDAAGGGGGGGAGACGGAGATGGGAGGSSIALLSFSSTIAVNDAVLITADAGNGGASTTGQSGQGVGGNGGLPDASGGCQGGKGGPGGSGGAGGGAAGGVSVGVAYQGTKPVLGNTNVTTGNAGTKGTGGKPGVNDGVSGAKEDLLQVQ